MARPPKKPGDRKDADLRIPVTTAQKATIQQAAAIAGSDMATWARTLLLESAEGLIAAKQRPARKPKV
jgi:uncharacterized protein (DUF1778 family)